MEPEKSRPGQATTLFLALLLPFLIFTLLLSFENAARL